ncbi:MAG: HD domain-containing protein [Alphaproteobacteria bacterium]|nr:HD domain-containing protein [Alphaproteobacteria bacterium]
MPMQGEMDIHFDTQGRHALPRAQQGGGLRFDLSQAVTALSSSLDLIGQQHVYHMRRVAVMALAMAHEMNWSSERKRDAMYAGLVHDCGISSEREFNDLSVAVECANPHPHCERGAAYLAECLPLSRFAPIVAHHHTSWKALCRMEEMPSDTRLLTNLVQLADRADVMHHGMRLKGRHEWEVIGRELAPYAGRLFNKELVECFRGLAETDAFWLRLLPEYVETVHYDFDLPDDLSSHGFAETRSLAHLFARIVDAKSTFTGEHSLGVGRLSVSLAQRSGLGDELCNQLEIAGLLHDIGKMRVPIEVIDKPGSFSPEERRLIRRHSYDSFRILAPVFQGTHIPRWASQHHERLNGSGYPFGLKADDLDLGARIIAVADVLQALAQTRPYRPAFSRPEIIKTMKEMADRDELDFGLVCFVAEDFENLYAQAIGAEGKG